MKDEKKLFYSNCFLEMLKAKIKNPKIKVMYLPAFLNEVRCPHWMWTDGELEYDFNSKGRLPIWKWPLHKGCIRQRKIGTYKGWINEMVELKYYSKTS